MTSLLIDTATEFGVVALFDADRILYKAIIPIGLNNSKILLQEIDQGLKALLINPKELKYIAVGAGPGSYTGIRVGVVVAKAFAYVGKLPLVSISSLDGFVPPNDGPFTAIIDAKISGAYVLFGQRTNGRVVYTSKPAARPLESLHDDLKAHPTLVSPNSSSLKAKLYKLYPDLHLQWIDTPPDIAQMVHVARTNFDDGLFSKEGNVDILYLRKTQAEIERGL